ncbi:MAG: hypothetical protein H6872_06000 [Methylobacteriaceae bacterium]|nr:hypothetical protein [Methylobacteriaceae bacterium]
MKQVEAAKARAVRVGGQRKLRPAYLDDLRPGVVDAGDRLAVGHEPQEWQKIGK